MYYVQMYTRGRGLLGPPPNPQFYLQIKEKYVTDTYDKTYWSQKKKKRKKRKENRGERSHT